MIWFAVIALIIVAIMAWLRWERRLSKRALIQMSEQLITRRARGSDGQPDLEFAAKGYMQVAVTRRHAPHIDLHKLERGFAEELLSEGCTRHQALSARWGGAYAISDELEAFDQALAVFKKTAAGFGVAPFKSKAEAEKAYRAAALMVIATVNEVDPQEYGRFLRFIGA